MFCASQAATAVCMSLDQLVVSSSSAAVNLGSGRAIDRHNPIIDGSRGSVSSPGSTVKKPPGSSTSAPSHPKPHQNLKPGRKSTSSKLDRDENVNSNGQAKKSSDGVAERKSSASLVDAVRKSSCIRPSAYFTPPGSKRYLLKEKESYQKQPHSDRVLTPEETKKVTGGDKPVRSASIKNDAPLFVPTSDKYYSPCCTNSDQVVVVRASLHCKGCAGKVKKHISRMQGVTSFNIDFDAKKVTVVGDVTPLEVLANISKVRTAQLLPPEKPKKYLEKI